MKQKIGLKIILLVIGFLLYGFGWAQVGIGTNIPVPSAQLDVSSSTKGFLPPRVALTSTTIGAPVNDPASGLLIYNTATAGTFPNNVLPGYYYWSGTSWFPVVNMGTKPGDMLYWNGTRWVTVPVGTNGSVLTLCAGVPTWGGCPILTIQPAHNPNDTHIDSYNGVGGAGDDEVDIGTWTINGTTTSWRSYIKFDQSQLPVNATIVSATLYLYSMPVPHVTTNAQAGPANAFFIERITTNWSPILNWNNLPPTNAVNRVTIPQSISANENAVINVTTILQDMQVNGNYGFALRLVNEAVYNFRQYASSAHSNAALHPKLVITYQ